jgi:hypothetical protein
MLGTTEWLHNLWPLEWYSAPLCSVLFNIIITYLLEQCVAVGCNVGILLKPCLLMMARRSRNSRAQHYTARKVNKEWRLLGCYAVWIL